MGLAFSSQSNFRLLFALERVVGHNCLFYHHDVVQDHLGGAVDGSDLLHAVADSLLFLHITGGAKRPITFSPGPVCHGAIGDSMDNGKIRCSHTLISFNFGVTALTMSRAILIFFELRWR
jgi:hypothetical protein